MKKLFLLLFLAVAFISACTNQTEKEVHFLPSKNYHYVKELPKLRKQNTVYVPIYSEIYSFSGEKTILLTATLSVRNTSLKDTIYIKSVDYHDSMGNFNKEYLKSPVFLKPLQSAEFVVQHEEKEGGPGANFIVQWGHNQLSSQPVIQAVMIGATSNLGISFLTEGVTIKTDSIENAR
jgi:hypothetical protein